MSVRKSGHKIENSQLEPGHSRSRFPISDFQFPLPIFLFCVLAVLSLLLVQTAAAGSNLIDAVKAGNAPMVRTLLKRRPDVNSPEPDGMTALHWAVRNNDVETAQLLIRAGANVKAANRYGVTPIAIAAENGNATL